MTNLPAAATNQALAKKPPIVKFIEERRFQIGEMLPKHLPLERFLRLVYTEMRKNPDLMACTPESVVGGMLTGSALGLEIGGALGEAYLIPFDVKYYDREERREKKRLEAEFVQGYKGLAKLFWQHPMSARLSAEYVCEHDEFSYDKGLKPFLHHVPAVGDRGRVIAYYAIVGLQGRDAFFDVFTPDQIKKIRGGKVGSKGNIKDPERWMERKTALIQVLKLAPKSTSLVSALAVDERSGADLWNSNAASAINTGMGLPELPHLVMEEDGTRIDQRTGELVDAVIVEPEEQGAARGGEAPEAPVEGQLQAAARPAGTPPTPTPGVPATPQTRTTDGHAAAHPAGEVVTGAEVPSHSPREGTTADPGKPKPATRTVPITRTQKTELRTQCIRLQIQSVLAEKLMWFELALGIDTGSLDKVEDLTSSQADKLITFLTGLDDKDALEQWGSDQQSLLDEGGDAS